MTKAQMDPGKVFKTGKMFYLYRCDGFMWFRIFGYGICCKNIIKHPLLFSQRNGFRGKVIGKYFFEFLKPDKDGK